MLIARTTSVYGAYKQLGSPGNPAFVFSGYPLGNPCTAPCNSALNIGAGDYGLPLATGNTSLPLFTWKPISGKGSYFVVVATDTSFQHVIDTAFTRVPAYAPRSSISVLNYPDTDTSYAWAVLPATGIDGSGAAAIPTSPSSYPQTFTLHSLAPTLVAPADNATVTGPPTFQWAPVPGAYYYQLTVATSSSFSTSPTNTLVAGAPFTTQSTTFVGSNFPTSQTLYWKVQAFDRSNNKLTFSPTRRFTESRPAPTFTSVTNATSGDGLPVFSWDPTPGAVAYDVELQHARRRHHRLPVGCHHRDGAHQPVGHRHVQVEGAGRVPDRRPERVQPVLGVAVLHPHDPRTGESGDRSGHRAPGGAQLGFRRTAPRPTRSSSRPTRPSAAPYSTASRRRTPLRRRIWPRGRTRRVAHLVARADDRWRR